MIGELIRYLAKPNGYMRPPNDYSYRWDWLHSGATHDQRIIMQYGLAKTPDDAQKIINKHGKSAREIVDKLPRPKRRNIRQRFILLVRRIDGHNPHNPYMDKSDETLDYTYKFK